MKLQSFFQRIADNMSFCKSGFFRLDLLRDNNIDEEKILDKSKLKQLKNKKPLQKYGAALYSIKIY